MECKYGKVLFYCFTAALCLFIFFYLTFEHVIKREFQPIIYKYDSAILVDSALLEKAKGDSIDLNKLVRRTDSISKVTSDISRRYQEDVNLMIYKTTQWLEFWLGIATIVFGFFTVLQVFRSHYFSERFDKLKEESQNNAKDRLDAIDARIRLYIDNMEQRFNTMTDDVDTKINAKYAEAEKGINTIKSELSDVEAGIKKSDMESQVSTLMLCISSFPDPAMFGSTPKKKRHLRFYLEKLCSAYENYLKIEKFESFSDYEANRLTVVLASLKYVIVRSQNVFSSYHQNITFDSLLKDINKPLNSIVENGIFDKDLNSQLESIARTFKSMIHDIEIEENVHD